MLLTNSAYWMARRGFYLTPYNLTFTLLIDAFSPWRLEFDSTPDHVEIILDKAALEQIYVGVFLVLYWPQDCGFCKTL